MFWKAEGSTPICSAAALANLQVIKKEKLIDNAAAMGKILAEGAARIQAASGGKVDRSVNLLTRKLTLVYPDHDIWQEAIAKTKAAGFKRVKRVRIRGTAWVVIGYK